MMQNPGSIGVAVKAPVIFALVGKVMLHLPLKKLLIKSIIVLEFEKLSIFAVYDQR
jgi:hypothetical protein